MCINIEEFLLIIAFFPQHLPQSVQLFNNLAYLCVMVQQMWAALHTCVYHLVSSSLYE